MSRRESRDRGAHKSKGQLARQRFYLHLVTLALGLAAIAAGAVYLLHDRQAGAQPTTPPAARVKLNKLTIKVDRPKLSPEDVKKLEAAQRNNKASE